MLALLLLLQQQPAAPAAPASPIASVRVEPAQANLEAGQTLQLVASALDAQGRPVPNATIKWFGSNFQGSVDTSGVVTGGHIGVLTATAVASVPGSRPTVARAVIHVVPKPAAAIVLTPAPATLLAGTRLTITGVAQSADGDQRDDPVTFASENPRVLASTPDGRITGVAPGQAVLVARAGKAVRRLAIRVLPNTVATLALVPASASVKSGDVVRFAVNARTAAGAAVPDVPVRWAIAGSRGVAQIDERGAFVAETEGTYTVTATLGSRSADAIVTVTRRAVGRGMEVLGRVPLPFRGAEVWPHPSGTCVYMSTLADRVYVIDVRNTSAPKLVDSMLTNTRIVNDVMTTEDGKYGIFTGEGASDRLNGIRVFEASDPCHPKIIAHYHETVAGGVHSGFLYQGNAYITDDATGSLRVISLADPYHPKEIARWQTEQTEAGRYVHDVDVKDGLAYLSYLNDGLVILDVGNGIKGGSPSKPVLVSQVRYDLDKLYARVGQLFGGPGPRGTHTAWRYKNYVFVGDEVYGAKPPTGLKDGNDLTFGRLHVFDVTDITHPTEVAWYEPTDGGVHNIWVTGDTLYMGNYQGGARALDVSGELKGDLLRQGREISWLLTADSAGVKPHTPFAWGAVVQNGNIFVPDINSGLWILKLEPQKTVATP